MRNSKIDRSIAQNVRFESIVLKNLDGASYAMLVLEACSVQIGGSLLQNLDFTSFFKEDASHEMSILRASSAKFRASLARNDLFGSLFCAICGGLARNDLWKKRMTNQVQRMTNGCGRLTCFSGYDCNISAWCMSLFTLALMAVLGCK